MSEPTHNPDPVPLLAPTTLQPTVEPPATRRKSLLWLWITLPIVLVLCICGGVIAVMVSQAEKGEDWRSSSTPIATVAATPSAASVAPSPTPTRKGTLTLPAKLAGRAKLNDASLADTAKNLFTYTGTVTQQYSEVYGRKGKDVLLVRMIESTDGQLTYSVGELSAVLEKDNAGLKLTATNAGPLGGEAVCGAIPNLAAKVVVCAWADFHSVGAMVFFFKTLSTAQKEFVTARGQVDKHS